MTQAWLMLDLFASSLNLIKTQGVLVSPRSTFIPSSKTMAGRVKKFYDVTAKLLSGEPFSFSALKGKVVLIENVASLWGTTTRDYTQMNELHSRYADKGLVILGVPCNQFGHQVSHVVGRYTHPCFHTGVESSGRGNLVWKISKCIFFNIPMEKLLKQIGFFVQRSYISCASKGQFTLK